ncbi:MAG TPA: PHP domain-containing protein [Treponema sp.]|nr:PHP domain-containing protein [Treponema sp.]
MIDLHIHTNASDGQYSPAELIQKAAEKGVSVLAVTDHDTVAGLAEAGASAEKADITFVPGIELNIEWPTGEFHLLGLGIRNISSSLREIITALQKNREERNFGMIAKMKEDGIDASYEELQALFPARPIGRPHFAAYLVEKKLVRNRQQAFDKYLAKGRKWYVDRAGANLDESVQAIVDSGGVPVIAHPLSLYLSWGRMDDVLEDIHGRGVEGLEAYHPGAREVDCERLEKLARAHNFFVTAGSDFHGEKIRADRKIGHTCGGRKIDDRFYYDELLPHLSR